MIYCCLVVKLCLTPCNPMDCSMLGFPVLHYLLEFARTPLPANAGDIGGTGSILGLRGSSRGEPGNPLLYSCLEDPMDREAVRQATVYRVAKSQTCLKQLNTHTCPLSWWCHPTISSSVASFSCCPQSFPASESFTMSWLFTSGGQSIGASASVLLVNFQGWFPLGLIMIYKCLLNCFVACSIYIW